ncbi:class I SAM-dependent methyltransferase [Lacipirellula limnantheis]|uniref:Methyltransferase domain protein n=1 Tax=Lacipirellula limnantheis TaxID=2528024 RepID=A0A517U4V3_9BACT|nr:class I SAM-dependent methyltransferase [Lacipirellula limnantheis]QDT75653.1 Methyltransferase domain protein [Lacipirellula limnantheis]
MDRREHWNSVYRTKSVTDVSWFESEPQISLELITAASPTRGRVIDVGGGASRLVDRLLAAGFDSVTVLDISGVALECAKARLGPQADQVHWIVGDVTQIADLGQCDVWHDRAVFHFLTDPNDRRKYVELATRTVRVGGHLIIGAFAVDGPEKCSGLAVCRYDAEILSRELGPRFRLVKQVSYAHMTPANKPQQFFFGLFELFLQSTLENDTDIPVK